MPAPQALGGSTVAMTQAQQESLYRDGYVLLPGFVPRAHVDAALRAINHDLGERGIPPDRLTEFRSRSYCPQLQRSPEITGLLNETPVWGLVEAAIGAGNIRPADGGQIALRFPSPGPVRVPGPHLDGMYSPTNGVPKGQIRNFTALVGVFLSDLPGPDAGNFTVWPGTHRLFEGHFRERGPEALLEGMPHIALPEPLQITGKAGDAILCHYQLAHAANGNASPHVRYACFFRLSHVAHESVHWECMTDIWREWDGMRAFARAQG